MLMRSVFPFSVIWKSILKSLIFVYPNLNYYRYSVLYPSILLIVEPLSVLSVGNENQSLDVVLLFFSEIL